MRMEKAMKYTNHKPPNNKGRFSKESFKNIFITSLKVKLVLACFFIQGCAVTNHSWKTTMWNDELNQLQEFSLDMTEGTCFTDGKVVYLWVNDKYSKEKVLVAVPVGDWVMTDGPGQIPVIRNEYKPVGSKL